VWNVLYSLAFPVIDPVLVQFGPFTIRWYALSYIFGILLAWRYTRALAARGDSPLTPAMLDDFVTWAVLGIVLGGRIGYVLFYQPVFYTENPAEIFAVWRGGMSFHGGLIGIILAMALFARRRGLRFFHLTDAIATATPIGLFLGRLANFVNGELFGRPSNVPWAMVFPNGGPLPAIRVSFMRQRLKDCCYSRCLPLPRGATGACAGRAWRAVFFSSGMRCAG